jgi:pyrroline-5-carboxylate reductase
VSTAHAFSWRGNIELCFNTFPFFLYSSAPAHFYYMMEALIAAGESYGLAPDIARLLVTQSCLGAGQLARDADIPVCALRKGVCVPGGSTGKAISHLEQKGFQDEVKTAVERSLEANRQMQFVEK